MESLSRTNNALSILVHRKRLYLALRKRRKVRTTLLRYGVCVCDVEDLIKLHIPHIELFALVGVRRPASREV